MPVLNARETTLEELEPAKALQFIIEHHKQGFAVPGKNPRAYGLYSKDELVAVALFGNPRTMGMQRRYTTELFRLAFKTGVRVRGGASKLIKGFMKSGAWDLFTYQDTAGEATDVYEHAGMTLVGPKTPKSKKIFVKNGLTSATATNNRADWFSMEQVVTYGPDRLIGSNLGTQLRADGTRKSNIDLFLELGYHIEEVPGDRIYEWYNPDVWFYTYKITSSKDDGYYFGRHSMRGPVDLEIAATDGYMGSGGQKFQNWVKHVGSSSLKKEVLSAHRTWREVIAAESKLIGDKHLTDPLCKNFQPGGTGAVRPTVAINVRVCEIHGETKHNGAQCVKCYTAKAWSEEECPTHGLSQHRAGVCEKCTQSVLYTLQNCLTHGLTVFRGPTCVKCSQPKSELRECPTHGLVTHWGETCLTCNARKSISVKFCPTHGEVKHQGVVCSSCNAENSVAMLECVVHGLTKHQGAHCMKCNAQGQLKLAVCDVHGEVTHKGGTCTLCTSQKAVSLKICPVHGETKHQGDVCNKCNALKSVNMRECPTHGLTKHQGEVCAKCNTQSRITMGECSKHGTTKFQGKGCVKCRNEALITVKECPVHGPWKHRGKTCYACMSDRRKANKIQAAAATSL